MFKIIIFLAFVSNAYSNIPHEDLIVDIPGYGKLLGRSSQSETENRPFAEYWGIPFAHAPINERRFKPSTLLTNLNESSKIPDSEGLYSFLSVGLSCIQPGSLSFFPSGEDCLNLQVFTPGIKKSEDQKLLPVIVFIHGGAFLFGTSALYSGIRLLDKEVVFVSHNYRMGAFGFLSLDTPEVPGNAGMYDMITVLKWVQNYIEYFGGDPNQVTIAGQSAGASGVAHLLLSPLSKGLFHKAIAISGNAISAWAYEDNFVEASIDFAGFVNCTDPDIRALGKCLERVNATLLNNRLVDWIAKERIKGKLGFEITTPTIQKKMDIGTLPFLSDNPIDLLHSGNYPMKVPLMTGSCRHDGSFILSMLYDEYMLPNGLTHDANFLRNDLVPTILRALRVPDSFGIYDSIAEFYLGREARSSGNFTQMVPGLLDISSVFFFKGDAHETALYHSKDADVYFYSFDYKGEYSLYTSTGGHANIPGGVAHADDLIYVFALSGPLNERDREMSKEILDYWINFATYGNPNGQGGQQKWPKFTRDNKEFIKIDYETTLESDFNRHWQGVSLELVEEEGGVTGSTSEGTQDTTPTGSSGSTAPGQTTETDEETTGKSEDKCHEKTYLWLFIGFAAVALLAIIAAIYFFKKQRSLKRKMILPKA